MQKRTFRAPSSKEVFALVYRELGADAIVIEKRKTRDRDGTVWFEVIAAPGEDRLDAARGAVKAPPPNKVLAVVVALISVAVAVGTLWMLWSPGGEMAGAEQQPPGPATLTIAVLPFSDLSPQRDQQYFCEGISEELINELTRLRELRVIARTSTFSLKGKGIDAYKLAKELNIDHLIDGSVRKSGDDIRISVNLIDVQDGTYSWSGEFNRKLSDILEIQEEVALSIAQYLKLSITENEIGTFPTRLTDDPVAFDYYLRGNYHMIQGLSYEITLQARDFFVKAIETDPEFAVAYARISQADMRLYWYVYDWSDERLAEAKINIDKAFEIDPNLAEAHWALGDYYLVSRRYDASMEHYLIAHEEIGDNTELLWAIARNYLRLGEYSKSLLYRIKAYELDPRSALHAFYVGEILTLQRIYWLADQFYERAISLKQEWPASYVYRIRLALLRDGHTANAERILRVLKKNKPFAEELPRILHYELLILMHNRDFESAVELLQRSGLDVIGGTATFNSKEQYLGLVYGFLEQPDLAKVHFESARRILQSRLEDHPDESSFHSSLGVVYAGLGRKDDAIEEGLLGVELLDVSDDAFEGPFRVEYLAQIYAMVGEHDKAIDQLEYLLSIPSFLSRARLRYDPKWDPLREHPRFKKLVGN